MATPGALEACIMLRLTACLARHAYGDWGCVDPKTRPRTARRSAHRLFQIGLHQIVWGSSPNSCDFRARFRRPLAGGRPGGFRSRLAGRVVAIADGDTFTLLRTGKRQVKIRLAEIDAPEKGQPLGQASRKMLSGLTFGKDVTARQIDTDRYGRVVARVFVAGHNANAEMVRLDGAWAFRRYLKDPSILGLENEARAAKRGLWAPPEDQRLPPWQWRARKRQNVSASR